MLPATTDIWRVKSRNVGQYSIKVSIVFEDACFTAWFGQVCYLY